MGFTLICNKTGSSPVITVVGCEWLSPICQTKKESADAIHMWLGLAAGGGGTCSCHHMDTTNRDVIGQLDGEGRCAGDVGWENC